MLSTTILLALFLGMLLAMAVLWAYFLKVGLDWAKVSEITKRRVILTTVIGILLQVATNAAFQLLVPRSLGQELLYLVLNVGFTGLLTGLVIVRVFRTHFRRAVQAWLPTLLASLCTVGFSIFVLRPLVYESYVLPTNGMAPTLLGEHWQGVCPECGQPSYCSPVDPNYPPPERPLAICGNFHTATIQKTDEGNHPGDRIMVARFLAPRRWDLIVFRNPETPAVLYVKRLVGLPGEVIQIKEGSVWADGKELTPPTNIEDNEYLSELDVPHRWDLWGNDTRPAQLADDEYFVLGDFSALSNDSRLWTKVAPGHSPFAVPTSYVVGVVTHTYWPIDRWCIHR